MDLKLGDKVVIVTGGAKGIGRGIVLALAREGAVPVIVGRRNVDNQLVKKEVEAMGGTAFCVEADLTRPEDCERAVREAMAATGRLDGLVNNAGVNDGVSLEHGTYTQFVESLHKSLIHYYLMAHFALPALKESKGSIVNISSKTAETGQGGTSAYAAANGGRNALTREWALELRNCQIRVNAVVVAECYTPQYETWIKTLPEPDEMLAKITRRIPLGNRMTTIDEIADTTVFLLSERSSHTTGQLIHVDGGYVHLDRAID